jgi:uncharacterized protein
MIIRKKKPSTTAKKKARAATSKTSRASTARPPTARPAKARRKPAESPPRHTPTPGLYGWITHTDLASANPAATKAWCARVLGWTFKPAIPGLEHVHLFTYSDKGGGAVRPVSPPEVPGSIPYVHVDEVQPAYDAALREGAEEMMSPTKVMEGVVIAIVRAPGGVPIGFSGGR